LEPVYRARARSRVKFSVPKLAENDQLHNTAPGTIFKAGAGRKMTGGPQHNAGSRSLQILFEKAGSSSGSDSDRQPISTVVEPDPVGARHFGLSRSQEKRLAPVPAQTMKDSI
jgi:hypothetical protein